MQIARRLDCVPFALVALAALGCSSSSTNTTPADTPVAQTAADVAITTDWDAAFAWAVADPVPVTLFTQAVPPPNERRVVITGSNVANIVVGAAGQIFSPSGCATAHAIGNMATFALAGCSGPMGLVSATGTVNATFTPTTQGLQIQLAGSNVTVDSGKISLATQGVLTRSADMMTKTIHANSTSVATGPFGNTVARTGSYTVTWQAGSTCGTVNGSFTESGSPSTTNVTNYMRCRGQCPQSGAVTRTFSSGSMLTVTFNGAANPGWSGTDGENGTLSLSCP